MVIPEKLLAKWKALRSEDDTAKIAAQAKVSTVTIRAVFRTGICSDRVFTEMGDYYNQKKELIKQYL